MEDPLQTADIKKELVDFEFVQVDSENYVHQLCTACLCATRTTNMLDDDKLKQYYMNILTGMEVDDASVLSLRVCWECMSVLKRAMLFSEQVKESYRILHTAGLMCNKEDLNDFLLTKASYPGRLMTCTCDSINISPTDEPMTIDESTFHSRSPERLQVLKVEVEIMPASGGDDNEVNPDSDIDDGPALVKVEPKASTSRDVGKPITTVKKETTKPRTPRTSINDLDQNVKSLIYGNDPYQCMVCLITFSEEKAIVCHMRLHTGEKMHSCEICQKTFPRQENLNMHMKIHSGVKPYQCGVCSLTLSRLSDLESHMKTHTADKTYECEVCQKPFLMQSRLIKHMSSHTGEKPFQCEMCPMSFLHNAQLLKHMTTHTGEKYLECEICSKVYFYNAKLIEHMRSHTGEMPFKCDVCLKAFAKKDHLRKHVQIHSGDKPYKCEHCPQAFRRRANLFRHTHKLHNFRKNYECKGCQQTFTQLAEFREHKKSQLCPKVSKTDSCQS